MKITLSWYRHWHRWSQWSLRVEGARLRNSKPACPGVHMAIPGQQWLAGLSGPFSHSQVGSCTLCRLMVPSLSAGPWGMDGTTQGSKHLQALFNAQRPWPGLILSWQELAPPGASILGSLPPAQDSRAADTPLIPHLLQSPFPTPRLWVPSHASGIKSNSN